MQILQKNLADLNFHFSGLEDEVTLGAWGLLPNSDYIISIKASNAKGESSPVFLGGSTRLTQNDASWLPINDAAESEQSRMPLLFVIVGILVTLMIMGALLTAILAVRRRREAKLNQIEVQSSSSSNQSPPNDGINCYESMFFWQIRKHLRHAMQLHTSLTKVSKM